LQTTRTGGTAATGRANLLAAGLATLALDALVA
jgi:hypothetical protein